MCFDAFKQGIENHFSFLSHKRLLLAVSGGVDSMVMAHLCHLLHLDIHIAHCNFQLRDSESDADASFVVSWAKERQIPVSVKNFDTQAYAKTHKRSTQMAARELRYQWFEELAVAHNLDYILTAHHANDTLETALINWSRGSGIKGLCGIPEINGKVVRPLLRFSRKQLVTYAKEEKLQWRDDSSNASDAYLRNALRHQVIPAFEKEVPHLITNSLKTQEHLRQSQKLLSIYKEELRQALMYPIHQLMGPILWCIDLEKLEAHPAPEAVLYVLLEGYGFTNWDDIYGLRFVQSGKQVFSPSHRLLKDRTSLQLCPKEEDVERSGSYIEEGVSQCTTDYGTLFLDRVNAMHPVLTHEIYVDASTLQFPLHLRPWEAGDYFYPFGMKGKKKISKFLKDEKLSLKTKENVWLLTSGADVMWVVGFRLDDRFKVTDHTTQILKVTWNNNEK